MSALARKPRSRTSPPANTIKSMTKEIKDNSSRRITNKKAVNEAKKAAEESQKAEKDLVEKSTQTITNTWEFYYNLQDE